MTDDEIVQDVEQYVKYALGLHIDRDAVAVLIAKRMLYYLELTAPRASYRQLVLL